jgi:hypothetical protein
MNSNVYVFEHKNSPVSIKIVISVKAMCHRVPVRSVTMEIK